MKLSLIILFSAFFSTCFIQGVNGKKQIGGKKGLEVRVRGDMVYFKVRYIVILVTLDY